MKRIVAFFQQQMAIVLAEPRILLCPRCEIRVEKCQCR